jgi:hypothetical protein
LKGLGLMEPMQIQRLTIFIREDFRTIKFDCAFVGIGRIVKKIILGGK